MRRCVLAVVQSRVSLVIISDAASPAPNRRAMTRNGRSVTPAMGASTTFEGNVYGPTFTSASGGGALLCLRARLGGATDAAVLRAQAGVDHQTHGRLGGVEDVHFRVDALIGLQQSVLEFLGQIVGRLE